MRDNLRKLKLFNDYLEVSQNREQWKTRIKEGLEIHVQEWLRKREERHIQRVNHRREKGIVLVPRRRRRERDNERVGEEEEVKEEEKRKWTLSFTAKTNILNKRATRRI